MRRQRRTRIRAAASLTCGAVLALAAAPVAMAPAAADEPSAPAVRAEAPETPTEEAYVWAFFTGEGVGGEKISLAASKGNDALD